MAIPYPQIPCLFMDIETVSAVPDFNALSPEMQDLWRHKSRFWMKDYVDIPDGEAACYRDRAAILAEFGKVVCISLGYVVPGETEADDAFRLTSFAGDDERTLLEELGALLKKHYPSPDHMCFCGHNIREFDVPYLCRRMLMHGMPLPAVLQISGKKPWEVRHLVDTLELWKFGDIKHFVSLRLLTACLGVPSPKDDIDGSQVGRVYYEDKDLDAIRQYCERDVLAVAQVLRRMSGKPLISEERVTVSDIRI
jgi:hypothetical protein